MKRSPMPARTSPLRTLASIARAATARKPPRRTGPERSVLELVFARDRDTCVPQIVCDGRDRRALIGHHRLNRGMGGSKHPLANAPSRLLVACWGCNQALEDDTCPEFYENGWKVRHGVDIDACPVLYPDGRWYLLDDQGERKAI